MPDPTDVAPSRGTDRVPPVLGGPRTGRLTGLDGSFLAYARPRSGAHADVGAVLEVRGTPPSVAELRAEIAGRVGATPGLRWGLGRSGLVRHPRWRPQRTPDVERLVEHLVPSDGSGEDGLREVLADLLPQPVPERDPWRISLVTGYADDEFAVVVRVRHATHDGVNVVRLLRDVFGEGASPPGGDRAAPRRAGNPWRGMGIVCRDLLSRTDPAPPLEPAGAPRRWRFADVPLSWVTDLARAAGVTVNDVFLTAWAIAVTRHLLVRGERPPAELSLLMPVDTGDGDRPPLGNHLAPVRVRIPLGDGGADAADPARLLTTVHALTARIKSTRRAWHVAALLRLTDFLPNLVLGLPHHLYCRSRTFHCVVTNLRGPVEPLRVGASGVRRVALLPMTYRALGLSVAFASTGGVGTLTVVDTSAADVDGDLPGRWVAALAEFAAALGVETDQPASPAEAAPPAPSRAVAATGGSGEPAVDGPPASDTAPPPAPGIGTSGDGAGPGQPLSDTGVAADT
ncbi:wax ester/triacylglycerol synthase domain-containing protein [Actinoalloteichus caeruleus]|uniref:wax ester/triacylglycerol synthase domain-containing protein n=1 Tax=Actinoalloteichus cyanogriseus TaxID=2893586 RepID=UPI00138E52A5|nr:wax ester/triacylglycerol synthase domain-containing protein [Actinoalloteichus caeruleus]